ncbi:antibiotic biosynthesis monooxygenase [Salipiger sp. P9]|uniref:antibiotic biosynthesis monooxygenase n=1 Tax=Salipiger pentaromativorans TaxID=2943193 RepID=UPI0021582B8E|nr:antibiotic biosynthesis monooxygenase [Salipiger pentaromativorans]
MSGVEVAPGEEGPVTVSISRRVLPGREADYEDWVHGIVAAASGFPGHLGVNVLRPSGQTGGRWVLIYRFDSWAHCESWEGSEIRARWIDRLEGIVEGPARMRRATGLEAWFELPEVPAQKPAPQWKMALVLTVVVFVVVYPLQLAVAPLTPGWPHWLRSLLIVVVQVLLLTYVLMPRVTRVLKGWLFA